MIEAKIISVNDKVMVEYWKLPKPDAGSVHDSLDYKGYRTACRRYMQSKTIAEVENIVNISGWWFFWY